MANQELSFGENGFIVSKTDLNGKLTYCNSLFMELSGYLEKELLGQPHNILRHEEMPEIIFKLLWNRIKEGKEIFVYVKNKTKNGDYYWAFAHVTPSYNANLEMTNYHSVRRRASENALEVIKPMYATLLQKERNGGVQASEAALNQILSDKKLSYDEFILTV